MMKKISLLLTLALVCLSCKQIPNSTKISEMEKKVNQFASFSLTADISQLTDNQKEMLRLFFKVSDIMDELFWMQSYGNKEQLLDTIKDESRKKFVYINYGPWERLNDNISFIDGAGEKPKGANFYPKDMTETEFDAFADSTKKSLYTIIQRDKNRKLVSIPYHIVYADKINSAAELLNKAAALADDEGFKKYLELRAEALLNDNYQASDMAWMDMKTNLIDFVVGPIENYEDQLYGYKTSYEAYILLKDKSWSARLDKYAALLPELQKRLPVENAYKTESPGSNSDLGAYEVLYYAGDCNAGSKTIAINLPNDEEVQLIKGSRRLQLKNAMKAKFEKIMVPIAEELIVAEQQKYITFDAFFGNVMFHEVAHGLGIKNTLNGKGSVREALKEQYSALEEGKADILGLFLETTLVDMKELETNLMDSYTTFLAGIFRSIRFGASSAHGKANLVRFNYFSEKGAFTRDTNGKYAVNYNNMVKAVNELSNEIIVIQGNGDYDGAVKMLEKYGNMTNELKESLEKINQKNIPVDVVFEQGPKILGLK
jgi:hypothetical protein